MTRDEILRLPAGRELDALVSDRIMNLPWTYSTDMTAAWQVVQKMRSLGYAYAMSGWQAGEDATTCEFWMGHRQSGAATAATMPHAVCLAALLAVAAK